MILVSTKKMCALEGGFRQWILPYQCRATAQQVEIASWLYLPVLISFKWCNIIISDPYQNFRTNTSLIQGTILQSLWNYFHYTQTTSQLSLTFFLLPWRIMKKQRPCRQQVYKKSLQNWYVKAGFVETDVWGYQESIGLPAVTWHHGWLVYLLFDSFWKHLLKQCPGT